MNSFAEKPDDSSEYGKLLEMARYIGKLTQVDEAADQQVPILIPEVEKPHLNFSYCPYKEKCEKLQKSIKSLEKRLLEREIYNRIQKREIADLQKKYQESENSLRVAKSSNRKLLAKYVKLQGHATVILKGIQFLMASIFLNLGMQTSIPEGRLSQVTLHEKLATICTGLKTKLNRTNITKLSIEDILANIKLNLSAVAVFVNAVENLNTLTSLTNIYGCTETRNIVQNHPNTFLASSVEVKSLQLENQNIAMDSPNFGSSFEDTKLKSKEAREQHRKTVLTVRKAKTFLQSKDSALRKLLNKNIYDHVPSSELIPTIITQPTSGYSVVVSSSNRRQSLEKKHCSNNSFLANSHHGVDTTKPHGFFCLCNRHLKTPTALKLHIMFYTQKRRFQCEICLKRFSYFYHLKSHIIWSHGKHLQPEDSQRHCETFQKTSSTNPSNPATEQAPHDVEGFQGCRNDAEVLENTASSLQRHGFHEKQSPNLYVCKCGMKFGNWNTLTVHIRYYPCVLSPSISALTEARSSPAERLSKGFVKPKPTNRGCQCHLCKAAAAKRRVHQYQMTKHQNGRFVNGSYSRTKKKTTHHSTIGTTQTDNLGNSACPNATCILGSSEPKSLAPISKSYFACRICGKPFICIKMRSIHMTSKHQIPFNAQLGYNQQHSRTTMSSDLHRASFPLSINELTSNSYACATTANQSCNSNIVDSQPMLDEGAIYSNAPALSRDQIFREMNDFWMGLNK